MARLICDDCGTLNSPHLSSCELCGESLSDEKRDQSNKGNPLLAIFAWGFVVVVLFVFFLLSSALFTVYDSPLHGHTAEPGIALFSALNDPGEHVVWAAVLTTVTLVGYFLRKRLSGD